MSGDTHHPDAVRARWLMAVTDAAGQLPHEIELGHALQAYGLIIQPYTYQGTARLLLANLAGQGLRLEPISD